jgi:hypothetical protein
MPMKRRCLIPGCSCTGFSFHVDTYRGSEDPIVETEHDELKPYCSMCGHAEEEHELAASE